MQLYACYPVITFLRFTRAALESCTLHSGQVSWGSLHDEQALYLGQQYLGAAESLTKGQ